MLSKDQRDRPNCNELLAKTHKWSVDTNIIRSHEYLNEFLTLSNENEKLDFFKHYLELKIFQK